MVRLGEPSMLTMPSQPNSRPRDSPRPYPHLNLLDQILDTSRGVFRDLSPRQPPPPPQSAAPAGGSPSPPASSKSTSPTATPPTGQRLTRGAAAANWNSAPRSSKPPPPVSTRANDNARSSLQLRSSARLNPQACAIKSALPAPAPQSLSNTMARTYPLSLAYNQCLGSKEDPYSFSSVHIEDLQNGETEYLTTVQQLIDASPKMLDPASRFALRGQVTPSGHQRLRHSMRAALWWLLPSDGDFRRASSSLHYYLARQGRRVVLRGGDVTQPLYESRMNWVHDPAPPASPRPIVDFDDTSASAITSASPGAPLAPPQPKKSRRRRRRRNRRSANQNSAHRSAAPVTPDERWANENSASQSATRPKSAANDLPKMMSTPVYQHPSFHSSHLPQPPFPAANENSAFQFGLDRCRIPRPVSTKIPRVYLTSSHKSRNFLSAGSNSKELFHNASQINL